MRVPPQDFGLSGQKESFQTLLPGKLREHIRAVGVLVTNSTRLYVQVADMAVVRLVGYDFLLQVLESFLVSDNPAAVFVAFQDH